MLRSGAWLGIDVGSSRSKVLSFCLVTSDGRGDVRVAFERGPARDDRWPANDAATFLDLRRPRYAALAVDHGVDLILTRSIIVSAWVEVANDPRRAAGAALDTPCGFAMPGATQRETERLAAESYDTSDLARFERDLRRFAVARNETPLRQRFFWKLVGFGAYRGLLERLGRAPSSFAEITAFCARGLDAAARDGSMPVPRPGFVHLREAFPSDTYGRANGTRGTLRDDARALLRELVEAPWEFSGGHEGRVSSVPTRLMQERLLDHRRILRAELRRARALPSMRKVPDDPSWADLWDAFGCAFVATCEAHGAAVHIGHDRQKLHVEGAVIAPQTRIPTRTPR